MWARTDVSEIVSVARDVAGDGAAAGPAVPAERAAQAADNIKTQANVRCFTRLILFGASRDAPQVFLAISGTILAEAG